MTTNNEWNLVFWDDEYEVYKNHVTGIVRHIEIKTGLIVCEELE